MPEPSASAPVVTVALPGAPPRCTACLLDLAHTNEVAAAAGGLARGVFAPLPAPPADRVTDLLGPRRGEPAGQAAGWAR